MRLVNNGIFPAKSTPKELTKQHLFTITSDLHRLPVLYVDYYVYFPSRILLILANLPTIYSNISNVLSTHINPYRSVQSSSKNYSISNL